MTEHGTHGKTGLYLARYTCAQYTSCKDGGWQTKGDAYYEQYANADGVSAGQACCVCGGGNPITTTITTTTTTASSTTTATTAPEAAPANYEEIVAENATESGSVCLTSNGEAPSTRRNYYSWSSSWSLQKCADKCDGMLAAGYGECYGFNLYNKFICTVYFEPVPVARKNTCTTCVKRCFTSSTKTTTTTTQARRRAIQQRIRY